MTGALLSSALALLVEHAVGLRADAPVLAVVLSLALSRTQRTGDLRQRLTGLVLVPAVGAGATLPGMLMSLRPVLGARPFTC